MVAASQSQSFPDLPLLDLQTAETTRTLREFVGKDTTVIDFWTTKCERCPQALDQLEELAQTAAAASNNNNNKELNFVSICCGGGGGGDGAREILEEPDRQPRWHHLSHYYMSYHDKETAKQVLGFQTVPFYVIVQPDGTIVHKGSKLPQLLVTRNDHPHEEKTETKQEEEEKEERVFEMDDDF